jgi:hypothetical protein
MFLIVVFMFSRPSISRAGEATPTLVPTPAAASELNDIQSQLNDIYDKLNSMQDQYIPSETVQPTEKPVAAPLVKVLSPQTVSLVSGRTYDVSIILKNVGVTHAYSVLTQVKPPDDSPFTVMFLNGSNSNTIAIENNEIIVSLRLITDNSAKPGTYTVEILNSFRDMYGVNLTQTDTIAVKIENPNYGSGPLLKDFTVSSDAIKPGGSFTLSMILSNPGPSEVSGVRVDIDGIKPEGVNMSGAAGVFRSTAPRGGEETLSYTFTVAKRAAAGSYPLTFTLKYQNPAGEEQSTAYTYYVSVLSQGDAEEAGMPIVEITSLQAPSETYSPGQTFGVQLGLANTGDASARRVKVSADGGEAIKPMSANIRLINRLPAGDSANIEFYFTADESTAKTQTHMIHFTLTYETGGTVVSGDSETDAANETVTAEQYAGVSIYNPPKPTETPAPSPTPEPTQDPKKVSKPKMIISGYKTEPLIVSAGKSFTLNMDFQNTHKTKTVSNLKIVLAATESTGERGSVFSPLDSGNTIFISDIPPGGIVGKTLTMMAAPDAQPRSYSISAKFNYQDDEFLEYEEEEQIGITVKQTIKLEISDLGLPSDGFLGEPLSVYCNIINSGRVSLSNLRVRVESDGMDTAAASVYLGALTNGSSIYYEGMMTPMKAGSIKGRLVVSGEDGAGVLTELPQDFEVQVQDYGADPGMAELENAGMYEEPPPPAGFMNIVKSFFTERWIWITAFAALLLVIILIIVKSVKRRRKQRSWESDE